VRVRVRVRVCVSLLCEPARAECTAPACLPVLPGLAGWLAGWLGQPLPLSHNRDITRFF